LAIGEPEEAFKSFGGVSESAGGEMTRGDPESVIEGPESAWGGAAWSVADEPFFLDGLFDKLQEHLHLLVDGDVVGVVGIVPGPASGMAIGDLLEGIALAGVLIAEAE